MESKDRPSQEELRSLFNDYLTGKKKVQAPQPQPQARPSRPSRPKPPKPPPPKKDVLPESLDPAQRNRLRGIKSAVPFPIYKRLVQLPELAKDPAAFIARWDRLVNGFGLKAAAGVLLGDTKPEEASDLRLSQLLRCDPKEAKALAAEPRFAAMPVERRALAVRDRVLNLARRWECPPPAAIRVLTGKQAEEELAAQYLSRKLRLERKDAEKLLARQPAGEPMARALGLVQKLQAQAGEDKSALPAAAAQLLESVTAEERLLKSVSEGLGIPEALAARLCELPAAKRFPPPERAGAVIAEGKALAAELGATAEQAARQLLGELPAEELEEVLGRGIASALGIDQSSAADLARTPEVKAVPVQERVKKAVRRSEFMAERLRCKVPEAAALLTGTPPAGALARVLRSRLGIGEEAAAQLADWLGVQPGGAAESAIGVVEKVEETKAAESCTIDQAALLVCGRLTPADIKASHLAAELGIAQDLALKLVAWLAAEKVAEPEAKARIRSLRSWAAETMDQACRMLIKEIPTPTKSDSDVLPFSGAWE